MYSLPSLHLHTENVCMSIMYINILFINKQLITVIVLARNNVSCLLTSILMSFPSLADSSTTISYEGFPGEPSKTWKTWNICESGLLRQHLLALEVKWWVLAQCDRAHCLVGLHVQTRISRWRSGWALCFFSVANACLWMLRCGNQNTHTHTHTHRVLNADTAHRHNAEWQRCALHKESTLMKRHRSVCTAVLMRLDILTPYPEGNGG